MSTDRPAGSPFAALAAGVVALCLWSGTPIANKVAVGYMDDTTAGVLRSLLAGLCALGYVLVARHPWPRTPRQRALLFFSGLSSFALWPMLASLGIGRTTAGHVGLLLALIPIFTVILAGIVDRQLPPAQWWVGAGIAFLGAIGLLLGRGAEIEGLSQATLTGDLIVVAGTVTCAIGYVAGGKLSKEIGSQATTFQGLSVALLVLVPSFLFLQPRTDWKSVPLEGWLGIGWMTFLSSLAGYGLWFFALGRGGIGRIGSLQLAMPVVTVTAAWLVLGEQPSTTLLAAGFTVVAGTVLAQRALRSPSAAAAREEESHPAASE